MRDLLNHSHARLERLFEAVLDAFEEGDRADTAARWTEFETCLRNHFDFEEVHLLPGFRKVYSSEAEEIVRDYERMRQTLDELGVGVDLHLTRADVVKEFMVQLRATRGTRGRALVSLGQGIGREPPPAARLEASPLARSVRTMEQLDSVDRLCCIAGISARANVA